MSNANGTNSDTNREALEALGEKLKTVKKSHEVENNPNDRSGMGAGLKYASEFSAAVIVGAFMGYMLDKYVGTSPWGLLGGIILGFSAGVLNVIRAAKEGMDGSGIDLPPELDED